MRKLFTTLLVMLVCCLTAKAQDNTIYRIIPGRDYYIWNAFYGRPLTLAASQSGPVLAAYSEQADKACIFTAEAAPTAGYVLLRHKASGRYICASTANSYATTAQTASGTGDAYQWRIKPGTNGQLVNKRNTERALGVDDNETKDEIGVWYDKSQDIERTRFEVFEAKGANMAEARKAWAMQELANVNEYIKGEIKGYVETGSNNTKYSLVNIKKFVKATSQIDDMLLNANLFTTDEMNAKTTVMRDSLVNFFTGAETGVLLTESELTGFGSTFSLSLSEMLMNDKYEGDSLRVLLRDKNGLGTMFCLTEGGNYAIVHDGTSVSLYREGTLVKKFDAYYVPRVSPQGDEAEWSIIRKSRMASSLPEILSETKAVTKGGGASTDKYGKKTRSVVALTNTTIDIDEQLDLHVISESAPLTGCNINLKNEKAWIIFDNVRPSNVINNYLRQIKINGVTASNNNNCRVDIYLNGAVVIPYNKTDEVFTGYDGEQYTKEALGLTVGAHKDLGRDANRFRSFRLKRGYMATLASDKNGKGYSRVYVADHKDIEVPVLPNALYGRISSVTIKKWQYVNKKGYCSTKGSTKDVAGKIRATWFYTWSADNSSSEDLEYIPIRQHKWWPSITQIGGHESTACLSLNEPEHSEQHNNCDCGGAINEWTACTLTTDFQETGMRIGSPAPTDAGWLSNYIGHCNDMAYRCDFVAIHCYWGSNEANDGNAWYNKLKAIYDATKRPIWITEWAYGASWTKESWPDGWSDKLEQNRWRVKDIMQKLEEAPFVERYAYYEHDTQFRNLIDWSDGHITPAGKVYRDMKSNFAYNADVQFTPVWWAPSLKTPQLKTEINEADGKLIVTITNENTDCTDILSIQKYNEASKLWEDYYVENDRSVFDEKTLRYEFSLSDFDIENDQLRVYVKRTQGDEAMSAGGSTGYITNPNIFASNKTTIEGWNCKKSAYNGYTKATGDTYFEVWSEKAAGMQFDYNQDIKDLPEGIYELSADVFNTTDNVAGATINGSVVLYAQADTVQYIANVTKDCTIDNCDRLTIKNIIVKNGTMRIGIKNVGEMSGRWAGADNFKLVRKADLDEYWLKNYYANRIAQDEASRKLTFKDIDAETADASAYVVNPSCQRTDTYAWTTKNVETANNESSTASTDNAYWNMWQGSAYTSTMTQDIAYLPEGRYSANALLRGSEDAKEISLTATVISPDKQETSSTAKIKGTGNKSEADAAYKNGWTKAVTDYLIVRPGDILRLTMKADFSKSGWWSADDFGLTYQYVEPIETGIEAISAQQPTRRDNNAMYDLTGRRIVNNNQKGLYIKGNKLMIKR